MEENSEIPVYAFVPKDEEGSVSGSLDSSQENGIVYIAIKDVPAGCMPVLSEAEECTSYLLQDNSVLDSSVFSSNIKIITLGNQQYFYIPADDDDVQSIEPHLIAAEDLREEDMNKDAISIIEGQLNTQIQIKDDSEISDSYEMVMLDNAANQEQPVASSSVAAKKKFACLYKGCEKSYTTSQHLTVHMRNHMNSKPYNCEACGKKFSTNYSLTAHWRTHTGEKPYGCQSCTKSFKTSGDLMKHVRIHTGEKPFVCPIEGCGKSFTTSNIRKVHVRSHTGERPYVCDYPNCGKAFASSTNHKNHARIHSGEKPYACHVEGCDKKFTEYSSLYKHGAVHQNDKPHECDYCKQKFKSEYTLNVHRKVRHGVLAVSPDGVQLVNLEDLGIK